MDVQGRWKDTCMKEWVVEMWLLEKLVHMVIEIEKSND